MNKIYKTWIQISGVFYQVFSQPFEYGHEILIILDENNVAQPIPTGADCFLAEPPIPVRILHGLANALTDDIILLRGYTVPVEEVVRIKKGGQATGDLKKTANAIRQYAIMLGFADETVYLLPDADILSMDFLAD